MMGCRRYFHWVTAHPFPILAGAAVLALAFAAFMLRLHRETSPDAFIPAQHPALAAKQRVDAFFGLTEPIAVGVIRDAPGGVFTPPTLTLIQDLTRAIQQLPLVDPKEVLSIATESGVFFEDGLPGFERLMKEIPTSPERLAALKQEILGYELYQGTLLAADGTAACIVLRLRDERQADAIYRSLRELLAGFPVNDERLVVAGEAAVRAHMGQAVSDDALRMNFVTPVVMFLLIVLAYRTLRGTLLPICVIGGAAALALGSMGMAGVPVYIVTNGIFVVLMALAVADSLHLLGQYYEEQLQLNGRNRQQVVVDACTALAYPLLITSLTDLAGFFALYLAGDMPPIRYFGLFTCAGILGALMYSFTVVPAGLAILPLRQSRAFVQRSQARPLDFIARYLERLGAWVFRQRRFVLLAGVALTGIAAWGATHLIVNDARILAFKDDHPIVRDADVLNARFDGTSQLNLVLTAAEPGALFQPEMLRKIEALETFTETLPHVGGTHSIAGWVKRAHQKLHREQPEFYAIPDDPEDTKFYLDTLMAPTCPMAHLLREVVDPTYTRANLIVRMRSSQFIHQREVIHAVEQHLRAQFATPEFRAELAGRVNLDYHWLCLVRYSHVRSVIISSVCVLLLTGLMFRSLVAGLLCTLTVGLVVLINYAVMGWGHIPLGVGTSMFASIAIGAGVNYPILILDRLRASLRAPGALPEQVFATTLAFTGRALFFTAFVLVIGFLLLCVSEFRTLNEFGLLIGLAIAVSFLVSVTLLPAVVAVLKPRFLWGSESGQSER